MANKPTYEELEQRVKELENGSLGRKKAEEQSNLDHSRLMSILDSIPDGVYIVDQHFNIEYINPVIERGFGKIHGRKCYQYFHDRTESCSWCKNGEVFAGRSVNWEWYSVKNDRHYELFDTPFQNPDGSISKFEIFHDITDRKRAEEALLKQKYFLQKAQEIGKIGTWELDIKKNELLWTDENYRIFGLPIGTKLTYEIFLNCVHPDDREYVDKEWKAAFSKKPYDIEHRLLVDGEVKWVREKAELQFNEKDECVRGTGFTQDITVRKQAEEELREKNQLVKEVVNSAQEGVIVYGRDLRYKVWNPFMERLSGVPASDVLDHHPLEVFPFLREAGVIERIEQALAGGTPGAVDFPYSFHEVGLSGWVSDMNSPLRDAEGEIIGVIATVREITDRKRAEEALRESEEKFRSLAENQHDVVWTVNENLEIDYISPSCFKMTGTTAEETMGMNPKDFCTEESYQRILMKLAEERQKSPNEMQPVVLEIDQYHKDGHLFPAEMTCMPIIIDNKFTGVQGITRDITERKNAEEEIRRLATAVEQSPSVIAITDLNGNLEYVNPKFTELTGYSNEEAIRENPRILRAGDQPDETYKELWETISSGNIWRGEFHNKKKSGELFWEAASVSPIFDKQGKVTNYIKIAENITERKKTEAALREAYNIINRSPAVAFLWKNDEKWPVEFVSDNVNKVFGYKAEEFILGSISYAEVIHPDDLERVGEEVKTFAEGGEGEKFSHDPYRIITKDGKIKWVDDMTFTRSDEKGDIAHYEGLVWDVSARVKAEVEKRELQAQLQQAQKMEAIGTLAGGIAHDFNNILGGIIGYSELAKMKAPEGGNVIAYLDKTIKAGNRAVDLIKQIMTLSRQHKQEQRPVQVRYIVKDALDLLRATLPSTIEIREDLPGDAGVVNADPNQIHQVIMNLGTNAGHAMQEGGGVLDVSLANVELDGVSASRYLDMAAGSYLRMTVGDTGYGMTSEIMERIFDPYFTTKDTGEGTGLGLSVAHGIVKAYGGTIIVYSELGKGTTFHVYLPLIHEAEKAEKDEPKEPLPTGSERILFIDDEQVLIEIGSEILEHLGYEVVAKRSCKEALELFRAEPDRFDLVITDMTMPHMTGDKLAQEFMKLRPDIPVILCTGHSGLVLEVKAKDIGIRAFVMKPLVMRNLAETVRKVFDAGRSEV
jgi:PAS domain S-box-containing protein